MAHCDMATQGGCTARRLAADLLPHRAHADREHCGRATARPPLVLPALPHPFSRAQEYQRQDRARRSLEYTIYDKELTKIKADIEKVRKIRYCSLC